MEHVDGLVESDRPVGPLIGKMEMEGALFSDVTKIVRPTTKFSVLHKFFLVHSLGAAGQIVDYFAPSSV